jgi:hypothetical protein
MYLPPDPPNYLPKQKSINGVLYIITRQPDMYVSCTDRPLKIINVDWPVKIPQPSDALWLVEIKLVMEDPAHGMENVDEWNSVLN